MTVFKTFLKVLNKCKTPIIMYTVFLVFFGGFNIQTSDTQVNFKEEKPDILIINHDEDKGITKDLVNYLEKNSNTPDISNEKDAISDALFYRDISYIIEIPNNFREDFLNNLNPEIKVRSTGNYQASLAEILLNRYLSTANIYNKTKINEDSLIRNINKTLKKEANVKITSKLNTSSLEKATFYFNFTTYCLLAGGIYVICMILASFKDELISKRTIISSMNYKTYNRKLLLSNSLFLVVLWLFYIILGMVLLGDVMFSLHGLIYAINSFVFSIFALTLAFLIGNLLTDKNAINGIVNVIALGSSFLCGAFVPMSMLPDTVLNIAHILPAYWYIKSNELIKTIEVFNFENLSPIIFNMVVILLFSFIILIVTNIVSRKKRKFN